VKQFTSLPLEHLESETHYLSAQRKQLQRPSAPGKARRSPYGRVHGEAAYFGRLRRKMSVTAIKQ
ncbi:MAG: hypothetical protein QMB71_01875, partial [Tolumonas sp.]